MRSNKNFLQLGWQYAFQLWHIWVFFREVIYCVIYAFNSYFLYKVLNFFFELVLELTFEVKVLQQDLLVSLMACQVLALSRLYLFRFSDE